MLTKQLREMERQSEVVTTKKQSKMKKEEVKKFEIVRDEYGQVVYPIEYSLSMIASMLSNFEHGISRLSIDNNSEEVYLGGVEDKIEELTNKVDRLADAVDNVSAELQSISSISETLENFLGWYIQFNEKQKNK